jgi:autotransporter-associated beta strand protein
MKTQNSPLSQLEGNSTHSRLPVERPIRLIARIAIVLLALLASVAVSRAASGVWTNDASSVWSATTNWANGTVADGSGNIADFTINNINTNTVTLDSSRSISALMFGNNAGTTATNAWLLNASGGSVLTLAGGTPKIAVSNGIAPNVATAALPIAGTAGLTKVGDGTLVLAGANQYSGGTVVNGGTLRLTNKVAGASSSDPLLYMSFNNVFGVSVINKGSGGHALDGTLTGPASIVPGADPLGNAALSIPGGSSSQAYVLVNSSVVPFNISGGATWTVAYWFKTSTAGACFLYQGDSGWANANTTFFLNQGGGATAGNQVGGVSYARGWEKGTKVVNDGVWHHFAMTVTNGVKTLYVDGAVDALTTDQWGGTGIGGQVRVGGNGGGEGDGQVGLNGLMSEVYIYGRALSLAEIQTLTNTAVGPTSLASAIPDNSGVSVASGALVDINGSSPFISSLTGAGTVNNLALANASVIMNVTSDTTLTANLTNPPVNLGFSLGLTKLGNATLTIPGIQPYRGPTVVNGGTLNITGSLEPIDNGGSTNTFTVNTGVVNFSGAFLTNYNFNIGTATNKLGAFYQTAGYVAQRQGGNGTDFQLGSGLGAFGYYYLAAGATNNINEIGIAGEVNPSGYGLADIYGTFYDGGWITLTRGTTGHTPGLPSIGILNAWPGSVVTYSGGGIVGNWSSSGGAQIAVVNIMGATVTATNNVGVNLNSGNTNANLGVLNVNNGSVLTANGIANTRNTLANFNNGTLIAPGGGTISAVLTLWSGGATIINNGFNYTVSQKVVDPAGSGESGISSFAGGAGYVTPPIVTVTNDVSDTTGIGATAIAQIDRGAGTVTNVIITSPGVNYTATPKFVLTGGNPTTPATITGAAPTANVKGGTLTLLGTGIVTMNGGYSYTGPTFEYGGTLSVVASNVTPSVAGNITVSNGGLTEVIASGATWPINNLTALVSNSITLTYGNVAANPTVPAITINGALTSAPTNNITVNAFGIIPGGQFPLIKYTSGTVSAGDFANYGLLLPSGVSANLVNNTGNKSIDLFVTSAPSQLVWNGVNGNNWDTTTLNWTNPFTGTIVAYQEHVSGSTIAGDIVTFDDTLYQGGSPWPTNINVTAFFRPFPVTVNSTLPYTLAGAGSLNGNAGNTGFNALTKNGTGSLTLLTSNNFVGPVVINGGSVIITNDSAFGASANLVTLNNNVTLQVNGTTTNNSRSFSMSGNSTNLFGVATNKVAQFGGTVSGGGGLTKNDDGTLILAGSNSFTGTLTVHQGTLVNSGGFNNGARVTVGDSAAGNGPVLVINGGRFNATQGTAPSIQVGTAAGTAGDLILNSGTLATTSELWLGQAGGDYGAMTINGGSAIIGSWFCLSRGGGIGVLNMNGGNVNVLANNLTIGTIAGTGNSAMVNLTGGTFAITNGGTYVGEITPGILDVSGSAVLTNGGTLGVSFGNNNAAASGILNLANGGTVVTPVVARRGGLFAILNFIGGTLKAKASSATFMTGLTSANVYGGGAVIDDGGNSITIAQPLLGATNGYGITSIPLNYGGGSGYIDSPIVTITDANGLGSNAMATAQINPVSGTITNIVIICPGQGFDPFNSFIQIGFAGGGAAANPPIIFYSDPTLAPNASGGLTKKGSGTVRLIGVNTFTGPITNNAGTLSLNSASTYSGAVVNGGTLAMTTDSTLTGPTVVTNGAAFTVAQIGSATNTIGDLTFNGGAALPGATLGLGVTGLNPTVPLVNCGALTFNGTNTVSLSGGLKLGANPIIKYTGAIGGGSGIANIGLILPQGFVGSLSNSAANSTVYALITSTGPGLVWSGTNTQTTASTNLWDIGSTTNWWLGATATSYQQPIIPGDAVTFNDSGSGVVVLNTNAGPSSMVISNNTKGYTFRGIGAITGPGGITKLGTGTVNMNLTNNSYSGDTVVSNGTLVVGNATALSGAANLNVGPSGILELNDFSETINGLSGSGTIQNSGPDADVLTMGNANGGGTWAGTIAAGVGGSSFIEIGTGNTIIAGTNNLASSAASQVNGGTMLITNGGMLNLTGGAEFWVMQNAGTASVTVDGGTLLVNSWLVVGRNATTANGTFTINKGFVQKSGGNNIVVGSLAATGVLIVNGGTVLNNGNLWLGENTGANATLYLNGGLIQATQVRANGSTPNTSVAYFNGGTLQASASSTSFLQVQCLVMSNGLVLDDNGFTLSNTAAVLQPGDSFNGGLVKKGSGSVYLDTANTYTGTTLVTNGTLAGVGSVAGPMVVAPAGNLGAGDGGGVGTFTIGGNLTLQGGATIRINKTGGTKTTDQVSVTGSITYGGTLTINNITSDATALVIGDTFQIFNKSGSGNFTSVVSLSGGTYSFNPTTGVLTVTGLGPGTFANPTRITSFTLNGANIVITGTNGQSGDAYYLLQSTNVALPLSQWKVVATNVLSANGNFTFTGTNVVVPGNQQQFYLLSNTNSNH